MPGEPLAPFWSVPAATPRWEGDQVHVWRAKIGLPPSRARDLWETLSLDEKERASRFRFEKDRVSFVVARGLLRAILGSYLDIEPARLRFCYNAQGKPALDGGVGRNVMQFNLAHSYGLALFAIARGRRLGVDLELLRPGNTNVQIAHGLLSPEETSALGAIPRDLQEKAFLTCWTRKEAYVKARGEGLSIPLSQFSVSLAPGEPAALLRWDGDPEESFRWSLQDLDPGAGYMAALAVEGHGWQLQGWQWPDSMVNGVPTA